MSIPKVKITSGPHGNTTKIEIDGVPVTGASEFTLSATCRSATTLTLVYPAVEAEVDALVETTAMGDISRTYKVVPEPDNEI